MMNIGAVFIRRAWVLRMLRQQSQISLKGSRSSEDVFRGSFVSRGLETPFETCYEQKMIL